jgi:hypothetical protein
MTSSIELKWSATKRRIEKWDSMKLKGFCTIKEMVCKLKKLPTE